jgi:hypothetical protein
MHSFAAFAPTVRSSRPQPCAASGEVFVISGRRFRRQPLEKQEIEFRRLTDEARQQCVDLPAVVGLVIEPVRQRRGHRLLELLRRCDLAVFDRSGDADIVEPVDEIDDPLVLRLACGTQLVECLEQDRIQPVRRVAFAGKPLHPDPVGRQQMVQGAVDRFEEGAAVGAILLGAEPRRRLVKPVVGPRIVMTEHPIMGCESHGNLMSFFPENLRPPARGAKAPSRAATIPPRNRPDTLQT